MAQRARPSAPPYPGDYVISTVRPGPGDLVVFEIVTDRLQRMHVTMPQARTTDTEIDGTIRATLAGVYRPPATNFTERGPR